MTAWRLYRTNLKWTIGLFIAGSALPTQDDVWGLAGGLLFFSAVACAIAIARLTYLAEGDKQALTALFATFCLCFILNFMLVVLVGGLGEELYHHSNNDGAAAGLVVANTIILFKTLSQIRAIVASRN